MTLLDTLYFFGFFVIILGLGLLIYAQLLGLLLRLHIRFFPLLEKRYDRMLKQLDDPEQAKPEKRQEVIQ